MGDSDSEDGAAVVHKHYPIPRLNPPDKFDFKDPGLWSRWRTWWLRYREASRLCEQAEKEQINTLVYTLGPRAEDVILAEAIPEDTHDILIKSFADHFGIRTNAIVKGAKCNRLVQGQNWMNIFINKLYRQAEYCEFGSLREELIRDRFVVGVTDDTLSNKLQSEVTLNLSTAVDICRRHESAKQTQTLVRSRAVTTSWSVDSVKSNSNRKNRKSNNKAKTIHGFTTHAKGYGSNPSNKKKSCHRCGKGSHPKASCPAIHSTCNHCRKQEHCSPPLLPHLVGTVTTEYHLVWLI